MPWAKGQKFSDEHKRKLSIAGKGRRHTSQTRAKMSESAHTGPLPSDVRSKISNSLTGRRLSEETRAKISASLKGNKRRAGPPSKSQIEKQKAWWTPERRQEQARRMRGKICPTSETGPELAVQERLERMGVVFEAQAHIDGDPYHTWDFAIPSKRVLIEVDGCYWHGCRRCGFKGLAVNHRNDKAKNTIARRLGWRLIRIKECRAIRD